MEIGQRAFPWVGVVALLLVGACNPGDCPTGETICGTECLPTLTVTARGLVNSVLGILPEPEIRNFDYPEGDPIHNFSHRAATNQGPVEVRLYSGFGSDRDGVTLAKTVSEQGGVGEWIMPDVDVTCVHRKLPLMLHMDDPADSNFQNFAYSSYFLWNFDEFGIPETGHILPPGQFPAFIVPESLGALITEALGRAGAARIDRRGATLVWLYDRATGPVGGLTIATTRPELTIEYPLLGYPNLPLQAVGKGDATGPCGLAVIINDTGFPVGSFDVSVVDLPMTYEPRSSFVPSSGQIQVELFIKKKIE